MGKVHEVEVPFLQQAGRHLSNVFSITFAHSSPQQAEGVWPTNSNPAVEIQGNAAARFPETDLKQVLGGKGSWRGRPKSLI